jgi:hypothetical protein
LAVLSILLLLALLAFVLAVVLWGGSLFAQSYFYTEPASGLFWRGPLVAAALTLFYFLWAMLNFTGSDPGTGEVPYPAVWQFSNRVFLVSTPVPEFVSKKIRGDEPVVCQLDKSQPGVVYKCVDGTGNWAPAGVEWIKLVHDGTEYTFEYDKSKSDDSGGYRVFVDKHSDWQMDERWIGRPGYTSFFRVLVYLFLNWIHLVLWFIGLWLVLRFSWPHALAIGLVMWFAFTLMIVPALSATVQTALRQVVQLPTAALAVNMGSSRPSVSIGKPTTLLIVPSMTRT